MSRRRFAMAAHILAVALLAAACSGDEPAVGRGDAPLIADVMMFEPPDTLSESNCGAEVPEGTRCFVGDSAEAGISVVKEVIAVLESHGARPTPDGDCLGPTRAPGPSCFQSVAARDGEIVVVASPELDGKLSLQVSPRR